MLDPLRDAVFAFVDGTMSFDDLEDLVLVHVADTPANADAYSLAHLILTADDFAEDEFMAAVRESLARFDGTEHDIVGGTSTAKWSKQELMLVGAGKSP